MESFISKKTYKKKEPYSTIHKIRGILYDCGIFCRESSVCHATSHTATSKLCLGDAERIDLRIATNGKGMTPQYSMASAYGEFMERLQCGILFFKYRLKAFDSGELKYRFSPDEKNMTIEQLGEDFSSAIKIMFNLSDEEYRQKTASVATKPLKCVPFTDALTGRQVYFPVDEMMSIISSNGMCAGNTQNEALAQGISELFERDCLMRIYRDNPEIKLLRKELFADTSVINKLSNLEGLGYDVKIFDGSMGMDYPVIGLILKNKDGILMNLGGDPNPIVALERCLTEMFQILTKDSIELRVSKDSCGTRSGCTNFFSREFYDLQFVRSRTFGSGEKPDNIFNIGEKYSDRYNYNSELEDDYDYLVNLIHRLGYHLYIRDCSYLGFPAFITYIPEISLADYRCTAKADMFFKTLENGLSIEDIDEKSYSYILPILKKIQSQRDY